MLTAAPVPVRCEPAFDTCTGVVGEGDVELHAPLGLLLLIRCSSLRSMSRSGSFHGRFLVAESDTQVIGTLMAGYDGHRGWMNYLAVDPARHGQSFGRLLMERAEQHLREIRCPKINLQIRADNRSAADFYECLGYSVDDVVSMGKRLVDDAAPER